MRLADRESACLSRVQIEEVVSADVPDAPASAHLAACSSCRAKADVVRRNNQLMGELAGPRASCSRRSSSQPSAAWR
jgi:predicted anti-sigma-YlaC factor YlaD